jgi:CRISPR system Cascade subunit CasA
LAGASLFETVLLNMVDYDPEAGVPFRSPGTDRPEWERDEPPGDVERLPEGYLDWLTWLSWVIRLVPEEGPNGTRVRRARVVRGAHLPRGEDESQFETMVGYRIDDKLGSLPVPLRRERAVWRDSAALFQRAEKGVPPKTLVQVSERVEDGALERKTTYPLGVYGVAFEQANALFWRLERLPLPLAYLDDRTLYGKLRTALGLAEGAAQALRFATQALAAHLLSVSLEGKLDRASRDRVERRTAGLGAERQYWARLEPFFTRFVVDQATGSDAALADWAEQVLDAARNSFEAAALSLPADGNSLHSQVQARGRLEGMLAKALRDHPVPHRPREEAV